MPALRNRPADGSLGGSVPRRPGSGGGPGEAIPDLSPSAVPAHPWPLPAAVGLAIGIAARALACPPLVMLLAVVAAAALLCLPRAGRSLRPWLLPVLLLVPVGWLRLAQWEARPDPLAGQRDRLLVLSGVYDGDTLALDLPRGSRVAVPTSAGVPTGRVQLLATIRTPQPSRNPGGFDYGAHLARRGVHGLLVVHELLTAEPRPGLRERLRRGVTAGLPPESAALMEAMTLGVRARLGALRDTFAAAGMAHVLALSGLHVGVLLAAIGWLTSPLGWRRYPLLLAVDVGYLGVVGASPSVVRAALMAAVVLAGLWLGAGRLQPWPTLGIAGLATLLARPSWLFDLGFQLSYLAVAGILVFVPPLARHLPGVAIGWWRPRVLIFGGGLTSLAAQLPALSLVAGSFGSIPLLSPLVNMVAVPLASLLVPLGFLAGLAGLVAPALAAAVNLAAAPLAAALLALAARAASLPSLTWGEVSALGHLYFAVAAVALALAVNGWLRPWRSLLVLLVAGVCSAATPSPHPDVELVALDVGQGDSFVLRFPGRLEVLVDGGGTPGSDFDVGQAVVLPALRALGIDELEIVVATHADTDHIEGLAAVLRGLPVRQLLIGAAEPERSPFAALMAAAMERGVPVRAVRRGETVRLGAAALEVLNPGARSRGSSNDDSVALAVYWRGVPRALLLGDISAAVERELGVPPAEVLVTPHHGSGTSTSHSLLAAARPRHAVVSAGVNRYGHPNEGVLKRLAESGATVHLTRDRGAVRLPLAGP